MDSKCLLHKLVYVDLSFLLSQENAPLITDNNKTQSSDTEGDLFWFFPEVHADAGGLEGVFYSESDPETALSQEG